MGNGDLLDSMIDDGLWCAFDAVHMGAGTERYTGEFGGITRDMQDDVAAKSHERVAVAMKEGRPPRRSPPSRSPAQGRPDPRRHRRGRAPGHHRRVARHPRPAFAQGRHHHRGQRFADLRRCRGDGRDVGGPRAEALGIAPLAELVSFGMVAGPDPSLLTQPSRCDHRGLDLAGLQVSDLDLFELNEAFAAVGPRVHAGPRDPPTTS